jgi:hypothetical protein
VSKIKHKTPENSKMHKNQTENSRKTPGNLQKMPEKLQVTYRKLQKITKNQIVNKINQASAG